ncbi:MAG TPA: hypothetical protein VMB34_33325 [Acetobacteraceae bacterium]|nr:hypothetical protein [Acetobacteraceae bacterium]
MRRSFVSLAAAGLLISQQAGAEMQCLPPSARAAFHVQALRSEMMVLATGCSDDAQYNAFIERYRPALQANEQDIDAWFKRNFGRRAQTEHDRFVTDLANAQSSAGTRLGTDFCPHNGVLFQEVMALRDADELATFAAGQNLVPASLDVCSEQVAEAPKHPVRRVASKRR